jgi:hypothetical protein
VVQANSESSASILSNSVNLEDAGLTSSLTTPHVSNEVTWSPKVPIVRRIFSFYKSTVWLSFSNLPTVEGLTTLFSPVTPSYLARLPLYLLRVSTVNGIPHAPFGYLLTTSWLISRGTSAFSG